MSAADITGRLARYMVEARERSLPPDVAREARHRILDSLAAMVSGAHLKPGEMAIKYARAQGGVEEAFSLLGSGDAASEEDARRQGREAELADQRGAGRGLGRVRLPDGIGDAVQDDTAGEGSGVRREG